MARAARAAWVGIILWCGIAGPPTVHAADDVHISAQVDHAKLTLGSQLTLTITLEGDFNKVQLAPVQFPKEVAVLSQSRASNVMVQAGAVTRSVSLIFLLMPQEAGTFKLGPFAVVQQDQSKRIETDPIDIVVKKPIVPPGSEQAQRYVL